MPNQHAVIDETDELICGKIQNAKSVELYIARGLSFTCKIKSNSARDQLWEGIINRRNEKAITQGAELRAYNTAVAMVGDVTDYKKLQSSTNQIP